MLGMAAMASLGACSNIGLSGLDDEWNRIHGTKGVALVSLEPREAILVARGREVVVLPSGGLCVSEDAVEVSRATAFLMFSDCPPDATVTSLASAGSGNVVEINLPPAFPGIVTMSVSANQLVPDGDDIENALAGLETFLKTPEGRRSLSRHGPGDGVEIIETRRIGNALYVRVQEEDSGGFGFLAPRYWRAFVELNNRLVVVTVSALRDAQIGNDEILAQLARQVADLRLANGEAGSREEDRLAAMAPSPGARKPVVRRAAIRTTTIGGAPKRAPQPGSNPRLVYVKAVVAPRPRGAASQVGPAPRRAPVAPRRPTA